MHCLHIHMPRKYSVCLPRESGQNTAVFATKLIEEMSTGNDQFDNHDDHGLAVAPEKPKLKRPPMFKVILLNDDYTPMEFVVHILEQFFRMNREKATQVMLHVHTQGFGVCGVFTKDVAETKVAQVNDFARANQHPLLCDMEEA